MSEIFEVAAEPELLVIDGDDQVVEIRETQVQVVEVAEQGPPGPTGPAGGATFERHAGSGLSALRVVWEDDAGAVWPLDYRDDDHIDLLAGVTVTAASSPGETVAVQRAGPLDANGLGLLPGRVWLGVGGTLTQSAPANGYDVLIGYATDATRIYIDIRDNIEMED